MFGAPPKPMGAGIVPRHRPGGAKRGLLEHLPGRARPIRCLQQNVIERLKTKQALGGTFLSNLLRIGPLGSQQRWRELPRISGTVPLRLFGRCQAARAMSSCLESFGLKLGRGFQPLVPIRMPLHVASRARTIWQYWMRLVVVGDCSTRPADANGPDRLRFIGALDRSLIPEPRSPRQEIVSVSRRASDRHA